MTTATPGTVRHLKTACIDSEVVIKKGKYADGSTALVAFDTQTGEQISKLTVSMVAYGEKPKDPDHVFIKDYSENEGVYRALVDGAVVKERIRTLDAGFATGGVFECELVKPSAIGEL